VGLTLNLFANGGSRDHPQRTAVPVDGCSVKVAAATAVSKQVLRQPHHYAQKHIGYAGK
jgi:hypothetical protein